MKNFKKLTTILLSLILTISSVSYIYADENKTSDSDVEKQETVYAFLDASGNFKSATVSEWLHSDNGFDSVKDESILSDIKNLKGDEQPIIDGNNLTWNSSNSDIYYQGSATKQLPLNMQVSYYFNDKKVDINDIVGQSGKLEIHIKLINNEEKTEVINGKTKHISTLFPCIILTDLKTDVFEDVKADGAIVINESKNQVVSFVTVSGASKLLNDSDINELDDIKDKLKDEFVISANVKDLEMPSIYCAVSGMVDLEDGNINLSDLDKLKDGIDDLQSAMNEILDGSNSLNSGANDLKSGASTLNDGVNTLKNGIDSAKAGAEQLEANSKTLTDGSSAITSGLETIKNSLTGVSTDSVQTLVTGSSDFKTGLQSATDSALAINNGVSYEAFKNILTSNGLDTESLKNTNSNLANSLQAMIDNGLVTDENTIGLYKQIITLLNTNNSAIDGVLNGSEAYITGVSTNINALYNGLNVLNSSYSQIDGGIQTVASSLSSLPTLASGIDQLYEGSKSLDSGLQEYTSGVSTLKTGLDQLSSGASELANGSNSLKDGANKLSDGASELNSGLNKFNNDGIKELTTKVNSAVNDLDDVVDVVNKTLDEANEYTNYAGADADMKTSVKFIMKTDEVSATDKEETNDEATVEIKEESTSFWQRLVNLFKKSA